MTTSMTAEPLLISLAQLRFSPVLAARVTQADGMPTMGSPVTFFVMNNPICTAITDATGTARCTQAETQANVLSATLAGGYRAVFNGTSAVVGASTTAGLIG
jgi:hypothetical protein